jgi:hypothetical protein
MKRDDPAPGSKQQAPETGHHAGEESRSLPQQYGETGVVLLPVSPDKVFAFWEIGPGPAGSDSRQDQAVLRFHESAGAAGESDRQDTSLELPIELHAGSRYLDLRQAGSSCQAEIGYTGEEGRFIETARSEVAETPRPLPLPEPALGRQPAEGAAPQHPLPPMPAWPAPVPFAQPGPGPGPEFMPEEEEALGLMPDTEEFLIQRRLAIFRHLSEAVPLFEAGHPLAASQACISPGPKGFMPPARDLTEFSERKFVAGISSK